MDLQNEKCVMVIDESLPTGMIANTAAIMGFTLGKKFPGIIGCDVTDRTGCSHLGIITVPVPILRGTAELIKELRARLFEPDYQDLCTADFSDVAQSCNNYDEFIQKTAGAAETELQYFGIAILGNKKKVNRLTGSMPLLR